MEQEPKSVKRLLSDFDIAYSTRAILKLSVSFWPEDAEAENSLHITLPSGTSKNNVETIVSMFKQALERENYEYNYNLGVTDCMKEDLVIHFDFTYKSKKEKEETNKECSISSMRELRDWEERYRSRTIVGKFKLWSKQAYEELFNK